MQKYCLLKWKTAIEILSSDLIKIYLKNRNKKPSGFRYTQNIYDFCKILQNIKGVFYSAKYRGMKTTI